jgi:hypothetical protein
LGLKIENAEEKKGKLASKERRKSNQEQDSFEFDIKGGKPINNQSYGNGTPLNENQNVINS